jgi:hypothetical protein
MIELEFVGLGLALYFFMAWLCYSWGYRDAMEKFVVKK